MRSKLLSTILKEITAGVTFLGLAGELCAQTSVTPTITPTNSPVYAGTVVTLTESATGQLPLFYQWQTDGGSDGALTNIPGATASNLTIATSGLTAGLYQYDVIVSNASDDSTSAVVVLDLVPASVPVLVSNISPSNAPIAAG